MQLTALKVVYILSTVKVSQWFAQRVPSDNGPGQCGSSKP
jgi:hypothetical protein